MSSTHAVRVWPLPSWLDQRKLLGPGAFRFGDAGDRRLWAQADLDRKDAADLQARLRGVGLGGSRLSIEISPPLPRAAIRAAAVIEARRHRMGSPGFSRKGARLDAEGRRSLTPEALALALGRRARRVRVVDACCGAGGNAIGFARAGCAVTAVERDEARLAMARHNAHLYGVASQIRFVVGDAREAIATLDADLLFVDPPWGGRYDKARVTLADLPLLESLLALRARFLRLWAKVPPSFDERSVPDARPRAVFGVGEGDAQRVKFVLLEM
jgi:predicted RNA methylase